MNDTDYDVLYMQQRKQRSQLEAIQNLIDSGEIGGSITVPDANFFASNTERNTYFTNNPSQLVDGIYCVVISQLQQYRVNTWVDISTTISGEKGEKGDTGTQGVQGIQGIQGIAGQDGLGIEEYTSLQVINHVSNIFTLNLNSKLVGNFRIKSSDANSKSIVITTPDATANKIITVSVLFVVTTACAITHPANTTFVNTPTFLSGQEWWIGYESVDGGVNWVGYAVRRK